MHRHFRTYSQSTENPESSHIYAPTAAHEKAENYKFGTASTIYAWIRHGNKGGKARQKAEQKEGMTRKDLGSSDKRSAQDSIAVVFGSKSLNAPN